MRRDAWKSATVTDLPTFRVLGRQSADSEETQSVMSPKLPYLVTCQLPLLALVAR